MKITLFILMLLLTSAACEHTDTGSILPDKQGPKLVEKFAGDIHYGKDICAYTGTVISTVRYGAILEMTNGQRLKFNSAESMAGYILENTLEKAAIHKLYVVDFADGDDHIEVHQALFLNSMLRQSPGKMHITPVNRENKKMLEYIYRAYPGPFLEWDDVMRQCESAINQLKAKS